VSWGHHQQRYAVQNRTSIVGPDEPDAFGSTPRTRYVEFDGTRDICPVLSVPSAIQFQTELGFEDIRVRFAELSRYSRTMIGERFSFPDATPAQPELHGAMTAFVLPDEIDPAKLSQLLWAERIEIPITVRDGRTLLRISHHFFTLEQDIDRLAEVLFIVLPQAHRHP
jgi:isopenicillin-N epimerase